MLRKLKRNFGITAPRMAIRTHIPWYWRSLAVSLITVIVMGLIWWSYDTGRLFAGFDSSKAVQELDSIREKAARLQQENLAMSTRVTLLERQLQVERVAQTDQTRQVKVLQDENSQLKEDLAVLHKLMATESKSPGLKLQRFKVERDAVPGEYRYQLLVVQDGQRDREFKGNVQFVVNLLQGNNKTVMTLPTDRAANAVAYQLGFKYYQRMEGSFHVPPNSLVKSVQVRIFEGGAAQPALSQIAEVS